MSSTLDVPPTISTKNPFNTLPFIPLLPQEIVNEGILSHLPFTAIHSLALTSKATRTTVLDNPDLWRHVHFSTLFVPPYNNDASTRHLLLAFLRPSALAVISSFYFDGTNITDISIILALERCPRLRLLSARYCTAINMPKFATNLAYLFTTPKPLALPLTTLRLYRPGLPTFGPTLARDIRSTLETLTRGPVTLDIFVCAQCAMLGSSDTPHPPCSVCGAYNSYCRHCAHHRQCHTCPRLVCHVCERLPGPVRMQCRACEDEVTLCGACAKVEKCPSCEAWYCPRRAEGDLRVGCETCGKVECLACFEGIECHCGRALCDTCAKTEEKSGFWCCEFCGERYCDECFVPGAACVSCTWGHVCSVGREAGEVIRRCKGCDFLWCESCKERMWMVGCAGCPDMYCGSCAGLLRWDLCQDCVVATKRREARERAEADGA